MSESFESFYQKAKAQYTPQLMEYKGEDMDTLRERIAAFLRPAYERALKKQEQQARAYNGQMDADAWSRGMGSSTYVSDLKYRRQNKLMENQADVEASYGAALAEQLYKAWEKQLSYRMEVEEFNAKAENEANQKALTAAGNMYKAYLASLPSSGGGSQSQKSEAKEEVEKEEKKNLSGTVGGKKNAYAIGVKLETSKRKSKNYGGGSRVTQTWLQG